MTLVVVGFLFFGKGFFTAQLLSLVSSRLWSLRRGSWPVEATALGKRSGWSGRA